MAVSPVGAACGEIDVEAVVPHVPPVLSLSRLEAVGDNTLTATATIGRDSIFCSSDQGVPVWIALEYLGQAVAALEGIRASREGRPVPLGYLLGTRRFVTPIEVFPVGAQLTITVTEVHAAPDGLAVFDGRISAGTVTLDCRFSVYRLTSDKGPEDD